LAPRNTCSRELQLNHTHKHSHSHIQYLYTECIKYSINAYEIENNFKQIRTGLLSFTCDNSFTCDSNVRQHGTTAKIASIEKYHKANKIKKKLKKYNFNNSKIIYAVKNQSIMMYTLIIAIERMQQQQKQ